MWLFNSKERLLEYAEREGKETMAFDIECTAALERAGNTLLNILLAGAGGALAMAATFHQSNADNWIIIGIGGVSVYLFALSVVLVWGCLWARDIYPPANEPKNLLNNDTRVRGYLKIKEENIESLQRRIEWNSIRNDTSGLWLNRVRFMASFTPVIMAASYIIV